MTCHARQYSDEMHCPVCRLRWDVNDPEPPLCGKNVPSIIPPDGPVTVAERGLNERLPFASGLPEKYLP